MDHRQGPLRVPLRHRSADRITHPLVRDAETGELRLASWPEAFAVAARGLAAAAAVGVLTGGRLTREDAYAYAKFARVALGTNDIDFRSRPHTAEEAGFLAARVAGTRPRVTYGDLERATAVVLLGLEPEEEAGIALPAAAQGHPLDEGAAHLRGRAVHLPRPAQAEGDASSAPPPAPRPRPSRSSPTTVSSPSTAAA